MTTINLAGPLKAKWFQMHCGHYFVLNSKSFKSILFGDSIIAGLSHYCKIWNNFFKPMMLFTVVGTGIKSPSKNDTITMFALILLYLIKCFGTFRPIFRTFSFRPIFSNVLKIVSYVKNATFCQGCQSIPYSPPDYYNLTFSDLQSWFLQKLSFSFLYLFGAFSKYKSLAFLLILSKEVSIMQHPPYQNNCQIFNSVYRAATSTYKANVLNKSLIF